MARLPRLSIPDFVHHVVQRGNNRQAIFVDRDDYDFMLKLVEEQARACKVSVHAYVLMPDHFHLLLTPDSEGGVAQMLQAVGRRYVQAFNRRHGRSGTLWDGRYRSTIVQDAWVLPSMVFLDLNPVRSGLVHQAQDYEWSSGSYWMGLRSDFAWLVAPAQYWSLGNTPFAREQAYVAQLRAGLGSSQVLQIANCVLKGWVLGDEVFVRVLQAQTERRLSPERPGRPRRLTEGL